MDRIYKYHYASPTGWMNDPNGMVYVDGVYHLFYQYYPHDIVWGPMHWGHAVSKDLLHWEHKKIAIFPTEEEYIFSGSCVYDEENVSGLGTKENPPLIALYTGHHPVTAQEQQCIAYSTDFENFTKYEGNPVIENRQTIDGKQNPAYKKDFRDPKVFLNPVKGGFSLVVAAGHFVEFYHSNDLISWEYTGKFAPKQEDFKEVCECPDCFAVETEEGIKWVLTLSLTSHWMPYFVGEFDGDTFVASEEMDELLDYGMDNYAMVSFLHSPKPILLGWGECWDYVSQTPAEHYRGKMTMARTAQLVKTIKGWRLKFAPVGMPEEGEEKTQAFIQKQDIWKGNIEAGESITFSLGKGNELSINVTEDEIRVDRSNTGNFSFSEFLQEKGTVLTAQRVLDGSCEMIVIQDNGYFEIFADGGLIAFSVMTYV